MEWMFQIHSSHAVVVSRSADLAQARNYAAQYARSTGTKQALVKQWLAYLESEKP